MMKKLKTLLKNTAKIFLGLRTRILKFLSLVISRRNLLSGTKEDYYSYDTLPLKTFFDIIKTGDNGLLVRKIKPKLKDFIGLDERWEAIIKRHNEESGNLEFNNYFSNLQVYTGLLTEYIIVKACVLKLSIPPVDVDVVALLNSKGYAIDLTTPKNFRKSLTSADIRSNNLVTKIMSKQNELDSYRKIDGGKPVTFSKAIANLSMGLGFSVDRYLTLSEYNEFNQRIKERNGRNKQTGFN